MTYDDVWQRWVSYDEQPGELIRHYEEDTASKNNNRLLAVLWAIEGIICRKISKSANTADDFYDTIVSALRIDTEGLVYKFYLFTDGRNPILTYVCERIEHRNYHIFVLSQNFADQYFDHRSVLCWNNLINSVDFLSTQGWKKWRMEYAGYLKNLKRKI